MKTISWICFFDGALKGKVQKFENVIHNAYSHPSVNINTVNSYVKHVYKGQNL